MTPDSATRALGRLSGLLIRRLGVPSVLLAVLTLGLVLTGGCSKDAGMESIETDAHGYVCGQCSAKFYTERKVFLESKCPKCMQEALADVTGYWCEKDKHLTIRPRVSGPDGAAVCEQCGMALKNAMVSPREKDLLAWGATKTAPQQPR